MPVQTSGSTFSAGRPAPTAGVADECRDQRGTALVENTLRDVRSALRSFRRAPLATVTIVATVAIGLGVVAVLFTVLNMFLLRVDTLPDISDMYAVERSGWPTAIDRCSRARSSKRYAARPVSLPTRMPHCPTSTSASMAG